MGDRIKLQEELNRVNELYQQKDLEMRKAGATIEQRQMMRDMLNQKKDQLMSQMGDDLHKLNTGKSIPIKGAFKKLAGIIPLAGAGMAALSGEPAMAAEELAGDIPVAGQVYEAIKPTESGNPEEERMLLAEDKARKAYAQSPARMSKLQAMMKGNK